MNIEGHGALLTSTGGVNADEACVLEMGEIAFERTASELADDPRVIGACLGVASVQR